MKKKVFVLGAIALAFVFTSCASGPSVSRIDASAQMDLSGFWNDTDVRIVSDALVNDILNSPRVNQMLASMPQGRRPTVLVGRFRNESSEQIDTNIISTTMETAIFNSGRLDFVAGGSVREELRAERLDQLDFTNDATAASLANETGADFMLFGTVRTTVDRAGNQTVRTYFVSAELTRLETNERVWMGQHNDIRKVVTRPRNRL
jgi:uncharacterized protein (TIGR02722 family)